LTGALARVCIKAERCTAPTGRAQTPYSSTWKAEKKALGPMERKPVAVCTAEHENADDLKGALLVPGHPELLAARERYGLQRTGGGVPLFGIDRFSGEEQSAIDGSAWPQPQERRAVSA
jgi:hypothetical protein